MPSRLANIVMRSQETCLHDSQCTLRGMILLCTYFKGHVVPGIIYTIPGAAIKKNVCVACPCFKGTLKANNTLCNSKRFENFQNLYINSSNKKLGQRRTLCLPPVATFIEPVNVD